MYRFLAILQPRIAYHAEMRERESGGEGESEMHDGKKKAPPMKMKRKNMENEAGGI